MGLTLTRNALIPLVISAAVLGCHKSAVQTKTPEDPLLISKKAVSGRPFTPGADSQAYLQQPTPPPPMPTSPTFATTSLPHEPLGPEVGGGR